MTPNFMIACTPVILTTSKEMPSCLAAVSAFAVSCLHLAQPVPRIWIFFMTIK